MKVDQRLHHVHQEDRLNTIFTLFEFKFIPLNCYLISLLNIYLHIKICDSSFFILPIDLGCYIYDQI